MVDQVKCDILKYTETLAKQTDPGDSRKMPVKLLWQCLMSSFYSRTQKLGCSEGSVASTDLNSTEQTTH